MKQPEEELQEIPTGPDDRAIVDYLIKNPGFFIHNARAVEAIRVPHPIRGIVSLVEWCMARVHNHIHALEESMALLTEQAIADEGPFYHLFYLQRNPTAASSLDGMLMCFHRQIYNLGLAGASLRLFPDRWRLGVPSNHTHLALSRQSFEPLRIQRLEQKQHYLGLLNGPELLVVLPETRVVGSVAISMLGSDADLDVVLFTSRDASHCQQGQETQLLHETALMLSELLACWIERV